MVFILSFIIVYISTNTFPDVAMVSLLSLKFSCLTLKFEEILIIPVQLQGAVALDGPFCPIDNVVVWISRLHEAPDLYLRQTFYQNKF
jgi:hypothetical protein